MTTPAELEAVLRGYKRVAVVGLSPKPDRPSHGIFRYLIGAGYDVVGVNPLIAGQTIAGRPCYAALEDIPGSVSIVDVFRRSSEVPPVADAAIAIGAKVLWLQDGVTHAAAEARARSAGLTVIADRCILRDHARLIGGR